MSETEDEDRKSKKKKDKTSEPDKSTPEPSDPSLASWIEALFRDDERADSVKVFRVFGKREIDPSPVRSVPFKSGEKPKSEDIVTVSNEIVEAMQNDANATRTSMLYEIAAFNSKKGPGAYEVRRHRVEPTKVLVEGWRGGQDGEGEVMGLEDHFRKRVADAWEDARSYVDKAISTLGGLVHVQAKQLEDKDRMIKELFEQNMQFARQVDEAQSHALDREMVREEKKFWLETKRYGRDMLGNFLLPEAIRIGGKMLGGDQKEGTANGASNGTAQPKIASQTTIEAEAIYSTMQGMTESERTRVFGKWTPDGVCEQSGILGESQVRVLVDVMNGGSVAQLDRLISGDLGITNDQGFAIVGAVGMAKIKPITDMLNRRQTVPPAAPKVS